MSLTRLSQIDAESAADGDVPVMTSGEYAPTALAEIVRDVVGAAVVAGSGITVTVNDAGDTITIASTISAYTDEQVRDVIGAALVEGSGIDIVVDDSGNTITITATGAVYTDEQVRDVVGATLVAGTGMAITVNDGADTITLDSTGSYTDENARDAIGATLVAGGGITITVNDGADTITIATTSGGIYPLGSPDEPPGSPNAKDDEFDGTSSVTWSNTPTAPTASDINSTRPGHLYIKTSGLGAKYVGKVQAVPGSYPYTIKAALKGVSAQANFQRGGGIILGPTSPSGSSSLLYLGWLWNSNPRCERISATFDGTFASQSGAFLGGHWQPMYLKIKVNSATSVDLYCSTDGFAWTTVETALNPGFTPGVMGLALNDESAATSPEVFFDWFRVS